MPPDGSLATPSIFPSAAKGAKDFVGRDWVTKQILDWMDHGSERFCLFIAEPGWGKSSLAAWMVGPGRAPTGAAARARLNRLRKAWSAAYLCSTGGGSTTDPKTFTNSVATQLTNRFDDFASAFLQRAAPGQYNVNITADEITGRAIGILTGQIVVEAADARDAYEQSVRQPLVAIADATRAADRIFILVDGLDDALTFRSPNIVDLVARSTDFPDRVRFFLTSRPEPRVLAAFPSDPDVRVLTASDASHQADNERDVRAYVAGRLAEPSIAAWVARTGRTRKAFVDALVAQADGNLLFTRFVLDNPPAVDGPAELQTALPAGLGEAYDTFLARVVPGAGAYGEDPLWTGTVRPVLGAMTVAVPAVPDRDMPRWFGPDLNVPAALATVGQVTEWQQDADGGSHRLYHPSLGDFLSTEELPPRAGQLQPNRFYVQPRAQHQRIVDYYLTAIDGDWAGDWSMCDTYGLRRLLPHLYALHAMTEGRTARAAIAERMAKIALAPGFQAAQRSMLGDGAATIEAIRLMFEVSGETADPPAIRQRIRTVATSWEPEMRGSAARAITNLSQTSPKDALDELKALLR
jgi:hypothetical protein